MLAMTRTARRPLSSLFQTKSCIQISEFDRPTDIVTHCPSVETHFPFHLAACLYQEPPNPDKLAACHDAFRKVLRERTGARVWTVREVLRSFPPEVLRERLIASAAIPSADASAPVREALSRLDNDRLIDLMLLRPRVVSQGGAGATPSGALGPLTNLTFTRDQQIVTARGLVLGRFAAVQRAPENSLMKAVWERLGITPVGSVEAPGTLEGSDFIPVSEDLAFLGVGLRTNMAAARQLMKKDLVGTRRLVVVEDVQDRKQERMHLGTVFAVIDEKLCLCLDCVADDHAKFHRIAHEFVKTSSGVYEELKTVGFGAWLKQEGFEIVPANSRQQQEFFLNVLHLGKDKCGRNRLLAMHPSVDKAVHEHGFIGECDTIDFTPITAMYGGVHCASQVLRSHQL
jgi:arginine deiminase